MSKNITEAVIEEYLERLTGPEGCDFREDETGKAKWKCAGGDDKSMSINILEKMGVPPEDMSEILDNADKFGGHCDCEIIFNADDRLLSLYGPPNQNGDE